MVMSYYPSGFTNGITIKGLPVQMAHPGKLWWLNNSSVLAPNGIGGDDNGPGTYHSPFRTLQGAVTQITAKGLNRGDILMVMPGHAENIASATALTINTAGLMIVGLGVGTNIPTFTLNTSNTATINVTANNISIVNCQFVANFLAIAACFTLTNASYLTLSACKFKDTSAILNFAKIVNTSSTDNAADGLCIEKCRIISSHATNAFSVFAAVGSMDRVQINDNYIKAASTSAVAIICPITAGKLLTNFEMSNNKLMTVGASGTATGLFITTNGSTNSGMIADNYFQNLATSPILVTASSGFRYFQNFVEDAADASGILIPAGA